MFNLYTRKRAIKLQARVLKNLFSHGTYYNFSVQDKITLIKKYLWFGKKIRSFFRVSCFSSHLKPRHFLMQIWLKYCKADAKRTPSYSSDLHLSGLHYRPDRGALKCSKICPKKLILYNKPLNIETLLIYLKLDLT